MRNKTAMMCGAFVPLRDETESFHAYRILIFEGKMIINTLICSALIIFLVNYLAANEGEDSHIQRE